MGDSEQKLKIVYEKYQQTMVLEAYESPLARIVKVNFSKNMNINYSV